MKRRPFLPMCVCALLAGCAAKAPPPRAPMAAPSPPPVAVPDGCLENLGGRYVHAEHPSYHYEGEDDGGMLTLRLLRTEAEAADGGEPGVVLRLSRTPKGFRGEAHAVAMRGARECPLTFPTEVVACSDAGLRLKSAASTSVDELCQPPAAAPPSPMVEQRLLRELPDAG